MTDKTFLKKKREREMIMKQPWSIKKEGKMERIQIWLNEIDYPSYVFCKDM